MAILLSGMATVPCGAVAGGPAGVAGFCWADTQNTVTASKTSAAEKRAIFMISCSTPYVEGDWTKPLVVCPATIGWLRRLKGAPDTKANDFLFFVKEKRKPVNELVFAGIGIIRKDQSKRYIDDGYLNPDFHSQARPVIADAVE